MHDEWGSTRMVSRGRLYAVLDFPGGVGLMDGQPQGLIIYRIDGATCEVMVLHSLVEGIGVGSMLIDYAKQQAMAAGCTRLWLITTNDNIPAIRWYQKRGFTIAAVHINSLAEARRIKPEIPLTGFDGIPIRDEIEFEIALP
ncbi:MAG: GNAT family N-acetyltransferase [Anaerolineae bacterium]|nr:GNAT family N-acetyltransferase [Anaerolineae bacterium]